MPAPEKTDEQRIAEFTTGLDSFRPEGMENEAWDKLKDSVVSFHKGEIQGLKINSVNLKKEKEDLAAKFSTLEASSKEQLEKIKALNEQIEKNQPEEQKKFYENQQAQLKELYTKKEAELSAQIQSQTEKIKQLEQGVLERDVLAEFNRVAATKDWLGGGREAAQTILLGKNGSNFSRLDMGDGTTLLVNGEKQDITQALNKFLETELGKTLLRNGQSGGGADGSAGGSAGGAKKITRAEYDAMTPAEQMKLGMEGVEVV